MSTQRIVVFYIVGAVLGFLAGWYLRGSEEWGHFADRMEQVAWELRAAERADRRDT